MFMTNIGYVHGFNSANTPENTKIQMLNTISRVNVVPIEYDTFAGCDEMERSIRESVMAHDIDILVGTSLGGYMVSLIGLPYISINPMVDIQDGLKSHVGVTQTNYVTGKSNTLKAENAVFHQEFDSEGPCLVLLAVDDEVIDAHSTYDRIVGAGNEHNVLMFREGGHRFSGEQVLEDAKEIIKEFIYTYDVTI